jgi:uncharacterized protein
MKYLIVLVVVLVGVWFWRNNRRTEMRAKPSRPAAPPVAGPHQQATEVVACTFCSLHLPRTEALPGNRGLYCSDAHRREAET